VNCATVHNPLVSSRPRRAVLPNRSGSTVRAGVRLGWSEFGSEQQGGPDRPTIILLPSWQIIDSQFWKLQVGPLSRHFRVISYDGRGTGTSDRPKGAAAYSNAACAADIIAVLDATNTSRAVLVALSCAATWSVIAAADHPDRVAAILAISPACGFKSTHPRDQHAFDGPLTGDHGWATYNRSYWLHGDFRAFREFFFGEMNSEPHSSRQLEDFLHWSAACDPAVLVEATEGRLGLRGVECPPLEKLCRNVRCPVTVVHGTDDRVRPLAVGERLAELTGGSLIVVPGGGHALPGRQPVLINRLIAKVVRAAGSGRPAGPVYDRSVTDAAGDGSLTGTAADGSVTDAAGDGSQTGAARFGSPIGAESGQSSMGPQPSSGTGHPPKVLFLSSPIGLGHAQRDIAIAAALRSRRPELQIQWLAQHPVSAVLRSNQQHIHPASAALLSESRHIETECGEHDLDAFGAIRRMDEILLNNFSIFAELVESEHFDLVIGDEAWEVDHFLHENPELKRFGFAWFTDFVGWLPMPDGGDRERVLTADYNAEMLEHRSKFRAVRDGSVFVGNPDDVVPELFGPGLPSIRSWVRENFEFSGYITGPPKPVFTDPATLRARWGCRDGDVLCLVTVGGSGVGGSLLRRVLQAVPALIDRVPTLRLLVVTGPRIDPASLPPAHRVSVVGYLPDLHRYLAACDVAIVQGGLTTCMELVAAGKPFVSVPLRRHFEQNIHVQRRLAQYGAAGTLRYEEAAVPELLADALAAAVSRPPAYRKVETDGAERAAGLLAELV
jgi:pimeloyl-ACP methyl ester carboxylesterase/predicted glycosyltransferase